MNKSRDVSSAVPIFVIVWDLVCEIPPSVVGFIYKASTPAAFGFQTLAEIVTSVALLYVKHGNRPVDRKLRERIASLVSAISFLVLSLACLVYTILHWNVRVVHDFQNFEGLTISEIVLMVLGIVGTTVGFWIEKRKLREGYSLTLHSHAEQLKLCLLSSLMVAFALSAAWMGWKASWFITPESIGGLVIGGVAYKEGKHLLLEWISDRPSKHSHLHS